MRAGRRRRAGRGPQGMLPLRASPHLAAIWLDDAGGVSPPERPARTFLVSAALPGEAPRASHTEEPRGISSAAFFAFWGVERPARGLSPCRSFLRLGTPAPYIVASFIRVVAVVCFAMILLGLNWPNTLSGYCVRLGLLCPLVHCMVLSLEFSFSRVVGHRFGGFDTAY